MCKKAVLINELEHMPEQYIDQVIDFIKFLKMKMVQEKINTALISESSLIKDWLKPEENEAWQNL